jgi:hypothetical protein
MTASSADVKEWLKLPSTDDVWVDRAVNSANAYVAGLPVTANLGFEDDGTTPTPWTDDINLGAVMLASRLYRRRNSAAGVEAITEAGAQYVARYDSDISRLLQIDGYQKPQVG